MSERNQKEARTEGRSVTVVLPAFTFLGRPQYTAYPAGDIVYFMYSGGRIKIGYSAGLRGRHKRLRASGPFQPVVFLIMAGTVRDEQAIHTKFEAERLHGEWFTLSPRLRAYLWPLLCDMGRSSLEQAEAEFAAYCATVVAAYKPAPQRRARSLCKHSVASSCPDCERERDLAVLDQINNGTYVRNDPDWPMVEEVADNGDFESTYRRLWITADLPIPEGEAEIEASSVEEAS